jgi:hypothetical protein
LVSGRAAADERLVLRQVLGERKLTTLDRASPVGCLSLLIGAEPVADRRRPTDNLRYQSIFTLKKIDDSTLEVTNKKDGKVTNTMKIVVAKDGKSRTNEASFTNPRGIKVHNIIFFDRK